MGGDFGPSVAAPAALSVLAQQPDLQFLLIGDEQEIKPYLQSASRDNLSRIDILHTPDKLSNLIKPENALRGHKNSSMYLAVDQVRQKHAQACVSAGNTGALMLIGRHLLKTIPGIIRPAMLAGIPTPDMDRQAFLLDVGAHINSTAEELVQFAMMGAVLASTEQGKLPRVGLLNIGSEEYKGTEHIKEAGLALEKLKELHYIGFIEANRIYAGDADVIVCDGFTGNVTIKTSAGVVSLIQELLRQTIMSSQWNRLLGLLAKPLLRSLQQSMDPARFNGASILGLQGIVIKSHGNAGVSGFTTAIQQADREITANVHERISAHVANYKRDF